MAKKKYFVNVHYDYFVSVEVMAESQEEALELAKSKADDTEMSEMQYCDFIDACVTDIE